MTRRQLAQRFLVGSDVSESLLVLALTPALFLLGFGWPIAVDVVFSSGSQTVWVVLAVAPLVLGALVATGYPAYRGQGVAIGWLLVFAFCCGLLFLFLMGDYTLDTTERLVAAVALSLAVTVPLGVIGAVVGYATRRLSTEIRP
ncbi:hypothetical protein [Natronorubrum texcoconense]|uniref:Uncharacterized protein n=1 Tax=Natronorubrum texcoconense TaxID=1095776 RepID=A0A1G9BFZ9_9EURY|nr:hypothetical protein [Natronorubrum texcoconense]SDK38401.1 hypothetical protein SAMN04515672_2943 [Natronorubrum texcoconense]